MMLFVVILVGIGLPMMAFVVDIGYALALKRNLQSFADSAALAAAQDLPRTDANEAAVRATAHSYSGEPGGKNEREKLGPVTTEVSFPADDKVEVRQSAESKVFFAGIFGFDGFDVHARAVAQRSPPPPAVGSVAIYVHEVCGEATNKGLEANGENTLVEGAIYVNGQFRIKDDGFRTRSPTKVYRPPLAGSPQEPGHPQGSCDGPAPLRIENRDDARYCIGDPPADPLPTAECSNTTPLTEPVPGPWHDWITAGRYDTEAMVKSRVGACTHGPGAPNNIPLSETTVVLNGVISEPRFYCLAPTQLFKLEGVVTGPGGSHAEITVIAGGINVNSAASGGNFSKLKPFNPAEPVLFYNTKLDGSPQVIVNPSGALDWFGYVINRHGGLVIDSGGVISPRQGLLEGESVTINGENFTMLGTFPETTPGSTDALLALIE